MLEEIEVLEIQIMRKQKISYKAIARKTGYSINTIRKYARDHKQAKYSKRSRKPQKLDDYKDYLTHRVNSAKPNWLPAVVLLREIQSIGYTGGISLLRDYLRTLKPKSNNQPLIRFETKPGEQMQVDFGHFRYGNKSFYAFVAVLGYSRMLYVEFVENQQVDTLIKCHENAFSYFGGIPKKCLYDNMKSVIIKRNAYGESHHKLNASFYDFAKHYGFLPRICKPYRPQTKGKVERMISYLRYSFYNPLVSAKQNLNISEFNMDVTKWLDSVANMRVHSTTKQIPLERWVIEKQYLSNIPINYTTNYGIKDTTSITTLNMDIMNQNSYQLQHELSVYDSLLTAGGVS